jgi:agmatine/peptidylarginine deiminase
MKKLEEILNLPESKKVVKDEEKAAAKAEMAQPFLRDISEFDKIAAALPAVKGLAESDAEFDALATRATDAFDDLMDLGMNVEARYSGRIFEVAGGMLKNAIDAKAAKIDKKLKMIDLQLKKQKLDNDSIQEDSGISIQGDGVIITDRNSLLEKLRNMK